MLEDKMLDKYGINPKSETQARPWHFSVRSSCLPLIDVGKVVGSCSSGNEVEGLWATRSPLVQD